MSKHFNAVKEAKRGLELLLGKTFYFYGVHGTKFKIDNIVLQALEDPSDGYRSYLGALVVTDDDGVYHKRPLAEVTLELYENKYMHGYVLRDLDTNHIWAKIGTDNYDDYYPCFVFVYIPDQTQTDYVEMEEDYLPFLERYPELLLKSPEWFNKELIIDFKGY